MGWDAMALESDDTYGIVVGTGNSAVSNDDSALDTKVAQGAGTGNLQYGPMILDDVTVDGNVTTLILKRFMTNASGADITIYEVGLYVQMFATAEIGRAHV